MRYVTIAELSGLIRKNLWKIPHDIDVVVGIPRSGMLAANMIALYLNTNLSDIDSFVDGRIFKNGLSRGNTVRSCNVIRKVLIVDDSIGGGTSIKEAKRKLESIQNKGYEYTFCVPIATSIGAKMVDLFFEIIDEDRIFEWNLFHHGFLGNACVDIDGVLCCDPEEDDDGEKYLAFLQSAKPLFLPTVKINTLISCRLEKYREQTEKWLNDNNISYQNLVMLNFPDKASRVKWGKHGEYKGEYYKKSECDLFIESSRNQASIIATISKKPVICVETNELVFPSVTTAKKIKRRIRHYIPNTYNLAQHIIHPSA